MIAAPYTVLDITLESGFLFKRLCHALNEGRASKEDGQHATFTVDSDALYHFLVKAQHEDIYGPVLRYDILGTHKVRFVQGWFD